MEYLEMKGVNKCFDSVVANQDVELSVKKGHIHALLGENGAGKSTLMNILYGIYTQDKGDIFLNGEPIDIKSAKDAIEKGIGMVHQHFMLIPTLSVIENVMLGYKEISRFKLNLDEAAKRFTELAEKFDMDICPWETVENLSIGQQQRLEILKALFRDVQLLILDEPTAVLTTQEADKLFEFLRKLTDEGLTIIFITHKLAEVMDVCDCCTVLRNGCVVSALDVCHIKSKEQLASLMVGKDVDLIVHKTAATPGETILAVHQLGYTTEQHVERLSEVEFEVSSGEILGVCGVDGNGQSELVRCIAGLLKPTTGQVVIKGQDVTGKPPKSILKHGVSHIPEDRLKMAMIKEMTVNENLILMAYDQPAYGRHLFLNKKWIAKHSLEICEMYNIKTPGLDIEASKLSGGNQQKLVVGRELDRSPDLLIAVHPARGLDIGATKYIQSRLVEERDRGAAVFLVSTDLDEILELSDRIIVMYNGKIMETLPRHKATREYVGLLMAGIRLN
ncbi:MAG TPA: ABC transporter ATP-binding protein [Clostridia bacterium]|nr:ABC transporter ATP-binding protein [Clostridia bacterium]